MAPMSRIALYEVGPHPDDSSVTRYQLVGVTDEMIEAGARAYYNAEAEVAPPLDPPWEEAISLVQAEYRKAAQIVLAAAFDEKGER